MGVPSTDRGHVDGSRGFVHDEDTGLLTKARARQNSCLWPWLKFSPPSVMMASENSPVSSELTLCQELSGWRARERVYSQHVGVYHG